MTTNAPVCHIPPDTVTQQPSPVSLPAIPPAEATIASLQHTVNVMRQVINILTGNNHTTNNNNSFSNNAVPVSGSWTQKSIATEVVRIYNPEDKTQYVDVERINKLVMGNNATKQTWEFKRPPDPSGK